MFVLFSFTLFYFSFVQIYQAFPIEDVLPDSPYTPINELQESHYVRRRYYDSYAPATTSEADDNSTNIISSVWHKISNIFSGETTTEDVELETRPAVMIPEESIPSSSHEKSSRDLTMNPEDFSRHSGNRETDEENAYPINQQLRMRRSDLDARSDENVDATTEVREWTKHDTVAQRTQNDVVNKTMSIVTEEFEQGETEGKSIERIKDLEKSTDWKTERIVVGSDPVENIDNENYIEESKKDDFPFHSHSIKPIIVVDTFSSDITTESSKELSPLQIIEY